MRAYCLLAEVLVALVAGCGARVEDDEARELLPLLVLLDPASPIADREGVLDALDAAHLETASLARVRDDCLRGHRALLEAERHQAAVRDGLRVAEAPGRAPVAQARERLDGLLAGARLATDVAGRFLPRCQDGIARMAAQAGAPGR